MMPKSKANGVGRGRKKSVVAPSSVEEDMEVDNKRMSDNENGEIENSKANRPARIILTRRSLRSDPTASKTSNAGSTSSAPVVPEPQNSKRNKSTCKTLELESDLDEPNDQPLPQKEIHLSPRKTRTRSRGNPSPTKKIDLSQSIGDNEVQSVTTQKSNSTSNNKLPEPETESQVSASSEAGEDTASASSTSESDDEPVPSTSRGPIQSVLKIVSPSKNTAQKVLEEDPLEQQYYACTICFRAFPRLIECNVHAKMEHAKDELMKIYNNADGNHSFVNVGKKRPSLSDVFDGNKNERQLTVLSSRIHGKGLFSGAFIPAGEIIIEYTGEIINRNEALLRQQYYDENFMDNYIMRMGRTIIDATVKGNCSKYINFSCQPNCETEQVEILGKRRVLIYSTRNILAGEELTYDYKFTSDELIPCNCRMPNCRKFINSNLEHLKLNNPDEVSKLVESLVRVD